MSISIIELFNPTVNISIISIILIICIIFSRKIIIKLTCPPSLSFIIFHYIDDDDTTVNEPSYLKDLAEQISIIGN